MAESKFPTNIERKPSKKEIKELNRPIGDLMSRVEVRRRIVGRITEDDWDEISANLIYQAKTSSNSAWFRTFMDYLAPAEDVSTTAISEVINRIMEQAVSNNSNYKANVIDEMEGYIEGDLSDDE